MLLTEELLPVNGEIKILQLKTSETVVLPLTKDVGEALKDYILNARPKVENSHIFIKLRAPFAAIKSAVTIGEIFRNCCNICMAHFLYPSSFALSGSAP